MMFFEYQPIENFSKGKELNAYVDDIVAINDLVDRIEHDAHMGRKGM